MFSYLRRMKKIIIAFLLIIGSTISFQALGKPKSVLFTLQKPLSVNPEDLISHHGKLVQFNIVIARSKKVGNGVQLYDNADTNLATVTIVLKNDAKDKANDAINRVVTVIGNVFVKKDGKAVIEISDPAKFNIRKLVVGSRGGAAG